MENRQEMLLKIVRILFEDAKGLNLSFRSIEEKYRQLMYKDGVTRSVFRLDDYPDFEWYCSFTGLEYKDYGVWIIIRNRNDHTDETLWFMPKCWNDSHTEYVYNFGEIIDVILGKDKKTEKAA